MNAPIVLFWFRRDLRLHDNPALDAALSGPFPVLPVFIFDTEILNKLPSTTDARVQFIHHELKDIKSRLNASGSDLLVYHGKPLDAFTHWVTRFDSVQAVYANRDYEPGAIRRDGEIASYLSAKGIRMHTFKDHVVFEKDEVLKNDGLPYTVYTPYSHKWKEKAARGILERFPSEQKTGHFLKLMPEHFPSLPELGFDTGDFSFPGRNIDSEVLLQYGTRRDYPAREGTTRLGIHLRFGTVSIRELTRISLEYSEVFLNELIWRNFFIQVMAHFPHVVEGPFKKQYAHIPWRNNEDEFWKWCRGETGYPVVDAGMRELNTTGFMHNRVRMITASFLTKHLLIDWRWGESYFAGKLLDFELASNNGNWQWAAGTGCDAAPYFRVFNPLLQQQKFDPEGEYIRKWVPEAGTDAYPPPMTDHKYSRERAIETYRKSLEG